ncbi:MAG: M48 family metallopeptidase [Ignavibacteria bacterium]|jgi:STE24 endopeptidase|nr:M48 family metallopeptidase [Ignavibacteria bacterium]MCU7503646.1 M48 family metallopeptidase [Ignavibacteria bacterium]MCU7517871.1 M48 family metallopeptidase [Ignavibacteria bacterium]
MDSKKYNNIKLSVSIGKGILSFLIIFLFLKSGLALDLENYLSRFISNSYLLFIAFVIAVSAAGSILSFPVSYYQEFYLEHKFKLSNQTFGAWLWEGAKGTMVSGVIGIPLLPVFYYVLNRFGNLWWLPFAIILFLVSVVLARIVPVLIMPLFYKITPLENEELKLRLEKLASEAGLKLKNVFKFDMSKNTRKANAAFTGMGKSKRILLGDNLLDRYSADEIETVIAHELGHYKYKHIIINIIVGTVFSFLTLYLLALLYRISLPYFGYFSITQVSAVPILVLWGMVLGIVETPITSSLSRKHEYQADQYAVSSTGKADAFISTLEKLNEQNLGDKEPHPVVEWFFYSHPSIKKRIAAIRRVVQPEALK